MPAELAGAEVAVFSDLQVGMRLANSGMIRRIVAEAVAAGPDAVVIAGDFVYGRSPDIVVQIDTVIELLAPLLDSGIPTFAVLGNHDYAAGAVPPLVDALERLGVVVERNESARLPIKPNEPPLYVVGIDAHRPGMSRPAAALQAVPQEAPG